MISATIVKDSISAHGNRVTTFELEYPRYIHAQVMTHRMFSRNSASSRAIPINRCIELSQTVSTCPDAWPINKAGMQPDGFLDESKALEAEAAWAQAHCATIAAVRSLVELGVHKEITNRLLEPFQHIKVVLTSTDFSNALYVRTHGDTQSSTNQLFKLIYKLLNNSTPELLYEGEWHLPYIETRRDENGLLDYLDDDGCRLELATAKAISASCCAQVSYRRLNKTEDKALDIYSKLVGSDPLHASAFEHQATPMSDHEWQTRLGFSEIMRDFGYDEHGVLYLGNFKGWIQFRKTLYNECYRGDEIPWL